MKNENKKELATVSIKSPDELISQAIEKGLDLDKLEKLLTLKERYDANEAKKAYVIALTDFKCEVPDVRRDKKNKQYNSTYASKGNLLKTITPILSKFGLSASFSYKNLADSLIEVTCKLTHSQGHSEEVSFSAPADTSGQKNPIQQRKSTLTYLEKITFAGILGIESLEEIDDDGNSSGKAVEYITEKEQHQLRDKLIAKSLKEDEFCKVMKIESLETLPKDRYKNAEYMIEGSKKK